MHPAMPSTSGMELTWGRKPKISPGITALPQLCSINPSAKHTRAARCTPGHPAGPHRGSPSIPRLQEVASHGHSHRSASPEDVTRTGLLQPPAVPRPQPLKQTPVPRSRMRVAGAVPPPPTPQTRHLRAPSRGLAPTPCPNPTRARAPEWLPSPCPHGVPFLGVNGGSGTPTQSPPAMVGREGRASGRDGGLPLTAC